ncbi:MAG: M48 family metallopeptidase [Chitinophagaceae bacterium]|nr:M48 family metallopeptidase [Chitinophagaceae bacterium]
MNWEGIFTYFNGSVAKPYEVKVVLYEDVISISDPNHPDAREIYYPLQSCSFKVLRNQAHVFLQKGNAEHLVIPIEDPVFLQLQSRIQEGHTGWFRKTYQKKGWVLMGLIVLVLFGLMLLAFRGLPPLLVRLIPVKQEIIWGQQIYEAVMEDAVIDSAGTELLRKFASNYPLSNTYPIQLTLVKDTIANAFAVPGGNIVVHSGLIASLKNPEELYALLSHEATHVNRRHSLRQMLGNLTGSYLLSMLGTNFGGLGNTLINQAGMLQSLSYSRQLETEADWEGQELMVKNGTNPEGMTELMESLQAAHPALNSNLSFLSTHPVSANRIKSSKEFSQKSKFIARAPNPVVREAWNSLKKRYP